MKKIILTLVFVFALGSFTFISANEKEDNVNENIISLIQKDVKSVLVSFTIKDIYSENIFEFKNINILKSDLNINNKFEFEIVEISCADFAGFSAAINAASGANYWQVWFRVYGDCIGL